MGHNIQKVVQLLAKGDIDEARAIHADLDTQINAIEEERDFIAELLGHYDDVSGKPKLKLKRRTFSGRRQRSPVIKEYAQLVAKANSGKASTDAVAEALRKDGYDLETSVPGTMIGNVLNKDENWERLEKGVFKYVG